MGFKTNITFADMLGTIFHIFKDPWVWEDLSWDWKEYIKNQMDIPLNGHTLMELEV